MCTFLGKPKTPHGVYSARVVVFLKPRSPFSIWRIALQNTMVHRATPLPHLHRSLPPSLSPTRKTVTTTNSRFRGLGEQRTVTIIRDVSYPLDSSDGSVMFVITAILLARAASSYQLLMQEIEGAVLPHSGDCLSATQQISSDPMTSETPTVVGLRPLREDGGSVILLYCRGLWGGGRGGVHHFARSAWSGRLVECISLGVLTHARDHARAAESYWSRRVGLDPLPPAPVSKLSRDRAEVQGCRTASRFLLTHETAA